MKRNALIFDLDGTLVDSAPDLANALNRLLAAEGRGQLAVDQVKKMVGDGVPKLIERGFAATGGDPDPEAMPRLIRFFLDWYEPHSADETRPFPHVVEALTSLKGAGATLAVCTNKPEAATREILTRLGLIDFFAAIVGGDTLSVRKPDPLMLTTTIERMGATPDRAVMIGDSANDVAVARAAGVPALILPSGYGPVAPEDLNADRIFASFATLPAELATLT